MVLGRKQRGQGSSLRSWSESRFAPSSLEGGNVLDITVDSTVAERWDGEAVLGVCRFEGCAEISPQKAAELEAAMAKTATQIQMKGRAVLEEPRVQQMRTTFRAMPDMDPGRYRPASESLIRRVLDAGFFRISPLVDANNLLSVRLRLPLGIYDLSRVPLRGWIYRLGRTGETYKALSQQEKTAGGKLVLADASGIFGSPVTDAGRAPIQLGSRDVAVVAYLPCGTALEELDGILHEVEALFQAWFTPERSDRWVVAAA
jgi:DNA/RNA-binding domain of Phe-tRNA-synthetase-like protein